MPTKKAETKTYGPYPDGNRGFSGHVSRGGTKVWAGAKTETAAKKKLARVAKVLKGTRTTD
jgi:hypothetical protein